jgi:hypothetical protein
MRTSALVVSLSAASMLVVGGFGLQGCGSVEPAGTGSAGSSGGDAAGAAGRGGGSGTWGAAGTGGTTGTAGTGGSTVGTAGTGGGNVATAGTGGAAAGGRGGGSAGTTGIGGAQAGGRGGSEGAGTGGRGGGGAGTTGGSGAAGGIGGAAAGGRGGSSAGTAGTLGAAGTLGTVGAGGLAPGGRGGSAGTGGGNAGTGGGNAGTGGGAATCQRGMCPALAIGDLEAIDDSKAPGFDAPGFRCKSLTICQNASSCIYFSADMLGSLQSADDVYNDGAELAPGAVKLVIGGGAASQCNDPVIAFTADEFLTLTFDGGKKAPVYLPAFMGRSLTLYIASDGSTFTDAALTMPARLRP